MCGLTGFWGPDRALDGTPAQTVLAAMAGAIRHRGPDAEGLWHDPAHGIGLGHRRLSILDLSPAGAQPMESVSGRYVAAYNGELYNHLALRRALEREGRAPPWRGHSDTETLLAAVEAWGLERALAEACGMFALALWDRHEAALSLARDRMGEKPLYYGLSRGCLLFGSELKAVAAHPAFDGTLDQDAIEAFLALSYVPAPRSIYARIGKLAPGMIARFAAYNTAPEVVPYWTLADVITETAAARADPPPFDRSVDRLEQVLQEVVAEQMLSDVPLGAFLSGGVDSSLITALMQRASTQPVRTFSIGFADARFNEAPHAAAVARHLGTAHTELTVTEGDALALVPQLAHFYDEPFADASLFPTLLISRLARREVTVALTGDGGDEVFGGYNRHVQGPGLWRRASRVPRPLRRLAGAGAGTFEQLAASHRARALAARAGLPVTTFDKLRQFTGALGEARDLADFYRGLIRTGGILGTPAPFATELGFDMLEPAERLMAWDTLTYLPGDILVKVDRAAMAASLETRAPLLDRRVVECAWAMPRSHRIEGGVGKRVLRTLLDRLVPPEITDRPKQGFAIPLDSWLRGPLRGWGEAALPAFTRHDALAPYHDAVRALWKAHQAGRANNGPALLNALVLANWLDTGAQEARLAA